MGEIAGMYHCDFSKKKKWRAEAPHTDVCNQHRTVRERDMQEKKKNTKSGFSILG